MPIRQVHEDSRFSALLQLEDLEGNKFGDKYEFFYRRMPGDVQARIQRKHTKKGVLDPAEFALDCVKWGCLGWADGVFVDAAGRPIPYSGDVIPSLPGTIRDDLFVLIVPNREDDADPLPRSPSTGEPS